MTLLAVILPLGLVRVVDGFTLTISNGIPSVLAATCATWSSLGSHEREGKGRKVKKGERDLCVDPLSYLHPTM